MTRNSHDWADLSTQDFAQMMASGEAARSVAVLPVAAIEQHGPHLPLRVDAALLEGVMASARLRLAPDLPVLFLPTQAVGFSPEHARFPGTLTLKSETILRLWTDIAESVAAAGVKKLLLLNSHGGQVSVMDIAARDWRARLDLLVVHASWFNLPLLDDQGQDLNQALTPEERRFGVHAGQVETAMMLALHPDLVDMGQAQHFHSTAQDRAAHFDILGNGKSAKLAWQMQDYNAQGAAGNAEAATAEQGRAWVNAAGRSLAHLLAELVRLPLSTLVDQPNLNGSPRGI